jgi:HSP20 family molecular chaperone IbpA
LRASKESRDRSKALRRSSPGQTPGGQFQISVALAGFAPDQVALTVEQNVLTLEGRKSDKEEKTFLHRGISARNFKHRRPRRPAGALR